MSDYFLADDLSGALDAAAGFHHAGHPVTIVWTADGWRQVRDGVAGVTTETRNAAPAIAAAVVAETIALGRELGARLVYKKIDSTLRGPVAAELGALARQMPNARILFAPANPRAGRTIRGGELLVHGVPVAETEFGRDPISPVKESLIGRVLGDAMSARVVIPEVCVEADLDAAVAQMGDFGQPWVAVGSGALARPVAARAGTGRTSTTTRAALPRGPTLMICGSAHPRNREQAAALEREHGVPRIELSPAAPAAAIAAARSALAVQGAAALLVEETRGDSTKIVRDIARTTAELVRSSGAQRLFITGGETAFAFCRVLGISSLQFVGEVEPGLSLSRAEPPGGAALLLAIKPGGFGDDRTWLRAWEALRD